MTYATVVKFSFAILFYFFLLGAILFYFNCVTTMFIYYLLSHMFNFEHLLLGFNFDCFTSKSIHTCSHHVNTLSYQVEMWISVIKMWVLCETIIAFIIVGIPIPQSLHMKGASFVLLSMHFSHHPVMNRDVWVSRSLMRCLPVMNNNVWLSTSLQSLLG